MQEFQLCQVAVAAAAGIVATNGTVTRSCFVLWLLLLLLLLSLLLHVRAFTIRHLFGFIC